MEDFWVNNYKILFDEWYHIFPDKNMSRNKILNSLTRFSIITLIIFYFINSSFAWYIIPLIILICCIFFGFNNKKIKLELESDEIDSKNNCRLSTNNNPYMNVLMNDNLLDLPACKYDKNIVDNKYKFNLYQNSNDIFDTKNLERQFYTTPVTTVPNNSIKFANWLYKTNGNCKYDNTKCLQYEDERYH